MILYIHKFVDYVLVNGIIFFKYSVNIYMWCLFPFFVIFYVLFVYLWMCWLKIKRSLIIKIKKIHFSKDYHQQICKNPSWFSLNLSGGESTLQNPLHLILTGCRKLIQESFQTLPFYIVCLIATTGWSATAHCIFTVDVRFGRTFHRRVTVSCRRGNYCKFGK